jgi:uncharacterized MAPEG superfamily protein
MPYAALVTVLALVEFLVFMGLVARARSRYGIQAPATSGQEIFDRCFRVQMNTLEQLLLFIPTLWIFAAYVSEPWAALAGVVFIIGRAIYAASYIRDPKSRSLGFGLTALPTLLMMLGIVIWAIHAVIVTATA